MNGTLAQQRCLNHQTREAVALCPQCRHYYCRECITEHDDLIICSNCLRRLTLPPAGKRKWAAPLLLGVQSFLGFMAGWIVFMLVGKVLLEIPAEFHEGTVWRAFSFP